MAAPLLVAVVSLVFGGTVAVWAVVTAVVLPPLGSAWIVLIYHREARAVSDYLRQL
jgi:hypothetical protein